jgi:hypothetical protein
VAELLRRSLQWLLSTTRYDYPRSCPHHRLRNRESETGAASADQGNLIL